jgi:ABC-type branched-subunit amino acid transport system substrate-binding protein
VVSSIVYLFDQIVNHRGAAPRSEALAKEATPMSAAAFRQEIGPHRIGVLVDLPHNPGCAKLFVEGLEIAFEELRALGIGDRPVELVVREYEAQPWKSGHANVRFYRELVEEHDVLAVAGPMTTDNCLAVLPELERLRVPSITIAGTQQYVGDYAFSLPNGGMADEPAVMAAWLRGRGQRRIALIREAPSQIGEEYTHHLRLAARIYGLEIALEEAVSPVASEREVEAALRKLQGSAPEALVYFGLGRLTPKLSQLLSQIGWDPPRLMGTAFVGALYSPERAKHYEGWIGLDQVDESNPVFQKLLGLYRERNGVDLEWPTSVFTCGYDAGRAFAIALDRMRIATGEALRDALETVTRLPAATGAAGTVVSFSRRNHRGFHGADYLLFRGVKDGKNHFVGTAPIE